MESEYHFKFEDLQFYQKAIYFGEFVNKQVESFPNHEIYKLSSQFIRPAHSIAFNTAEGNGSTDVNFNRYFKIA